MSFSSCLRSQIAGLLAIPLMMTSCAGDAPQEKGNPTEADFIITAATRAVDSFESGDNELISDWLMVFTEVKAEGGTETPGAIRLVASRPAGNAGAVRQEAVSVELPSGEYFIFAFANLAKSKIEACLGVTLEKGSAVPADILQKIWTDTQGYNGFTGAIPMSGMARVHVTERVHEPYAVEVVRMLAKLEFSFTNATQTDISVSGIKMKPINQGPIYLFGRYGAGGEFLRSERPALPAAATEGTFNIPLASPLSLAKGSAASTHHTYLMESEADNHATKHFHLEFEVSRPGIARQSLYALVGAVKDESGDLGHITRNNHIQIPVTFTDWEVTFEARFYPPIGGYPAMTTEEVEDEFYFKFATPGRFVIIPRIRRINPDGTRGDWLTVAGLQELGIEVTAGEEIFDETPAADTKTGEIIGYLNGGIGTSEIKLTFNLPAEAGAKPLSPVKRIYIIRE